MEQVRPDQPHPETVPGASDNGVDPRLVELLRAALMPAVLEQRAGSPPPEPKKEEKEKKPEEQVPLFWKLCSAALLSITALIVVTLYNQLSATASQVRGDVGQLRSELSQLRTDLVPKDEYTLRNEQTVKSLKDVQTSNRTAAEQWKEKGQEQRTTVANLQMQIRELDRELQRMREQLSAMEQREGATPGSPPRDKSKVP
jgi:hypothetical protein